VPGSSNFQELQQQVWKEIIRKGCSEASAALEQMLGFPLKMTGVVAGTIPVAKITFLAGDPEKIVVGARLHFSGDIAGHMILILWPESWDKCKKALMPMVGDKDLEASAFAELANVTCSFFIMNLANITNLSINFTPPEVMEDMTATVLEDTLIKFGEEASELLTIETTFSSPDVEIKGFLFFIPSQASIKTITQRFLEAAANLDRNQTGG